MKSPTSKSNQYEQQYLKYSTNMWVMKTKGVQINITSVTVTQAAIYWGVSINNISPCVSDECEGLSEGSWGVMWWIFPERDSERTCLMRGGKVLFKCQPLSEGGHIRALCVMCHMEGRSLRFWFDNEKAESNQHNRTEQDVQHNRLIYESQGRILKF